MKPILIKIISGLILLIWLVVIYTTVFLVESGFVTEIILPGFALFFMAIFLFHGASKFSSITGKILIFAGFLSAMALFLEKGLDILNTKGLIATLSLATGIFLERINPHQQLKEWMLLGIAAKVQFMIVTALVLAGKNIYFNNNYFLLEAWWIVIPLMLLGIPLLAFKRVRAYRIVALATAIVLIFLTFNIIITGPIDKFVLFLVALAFLWPVITERIIGRKVFIFK